MTPRIPLSRCRRCVHFNGHACPLNDLDPCIMAPTEEERMRTRIGLVCTFIVAVICAAVLVFAGCSGSNPTEFDGNKHWSAVQLLREQHRDELTDFDKLTLAIALTESRFNPKADSGAGDNGLLQLRSCYIDEVNRLYGTEYTIEDAFDIDKSLEMFRLMQAYYNPSKDIMEGIRHHNKSNSYRRTVLENLEMINRYEALRAKLIMTHY